MHAFVSKNIVCYIKVAYNDALQTMAYKRVVYDPKLDAFSRCDFDVYKGWDDVAENSLRSHFFWQEFLLQTRFLYKN